MSYARFNETSDVYMYLDHRLGLVCCACSLMPQETEYSTFFEEELTINTNFVAGNDYDSMLQHVAEHRRRGDKVPDKVDKRLEAEKASVS